jgi:hypothetical protein
MTTDKKEPDSTGFFVICHLSFVIERGLAEPVAEPVGFNPGKDG